MLCTGRCVMLPERSCTKPDGKPGRCFLFCFISCPKGLKCAIDSLLFDQASEPLDISVHAVEWQPCS